MLIEIQPNRFIDHKEVKYIYMDLYGFKKIPCIVIKTKSIGKIVLTDFESFEDLENKFNSYVSLVNEWEMYLIKESRKVIKESKVIGKFSQYKEGK